MHAVFFFILKSAFTLSFQFQATRRASDTFADPRTRPLFARSGRNALFSDNNSDAGSDRQINIVRDDKAAVPADQEKGLYMTCALQIYGVCPLNRTAHQCNLR